MNRKKGIIIGTTGIIIVTLALIGFTYGFYLSLISGNETSKKVKITAGKSKLEYVELSTEVDTIIGPGYTNTKYFAVQNVGDISASYYLYLVDVENTFNRKNDIVYTIYRKAYDYSKTNAEPESFDTTATYAFSEWENVTNTYCPTVSEYTDYGDCQYPAEKSQLSTQKQTIMETNDYYVYAFVVTYINQPDIDQIDDEESIFSGKIKVYADESGTDVSPFDDGTLADAIVENALANKNGTIYSETPLTTPGVEVNGENEATLSLTTDDYGPSYYFRGNVTDNFVTFSGMCWRIVRIQGDGGIKLVLADEHHICSEDVEPNDDGTYSGYNKNHGTSAFIGSDNAYGVNNQTFSYDFNNWSSMDETSLYYEDSNIENGLNAWINGGDYIHYDYGSSTEYSKTFDQMISDEKQELLFENNWCQDFSIYSETEFTIESNSTIYSLTTYNPYYRIKNATPTLKCNAQGVKTVTSNIGMLTADEVVYAGSSIKKISGYLLTNTDSSNTFGYWLLTPGLMSNEGAGYYSENMFYVSPTSLGMTLPADAFYSVRPAIVLKAGTTFVEGGEGTQSNPYVVE